MGRGGSEGDLGGALSLARSAVEERAPESSYAPTPKAKQWDEAPVELWNEENTPAEIKFEGPTVLVIGGVPGSGKSYLLRRLGLSDDAIAPDDVHQELIGERVDSAGVSVDTTRSDNARVHREVCRRAGENLRSRGYCVIDAPALYPHISRGYQTLARENHAKIYTIFCQATPAEVSSGQRERGRELRPEANARYRELWELTLGYLESGDDGAQPTDWVGVLPSRAAADRLQKISFQTTAEQRSELRDRYEREKLQRRRERELRARRLREDPEYRAQIQALNERSRQRREARRRKAQELREKRSRRAESAR